MSWSELCVHRSRSAAGDLVVRFGVAVLDAYLAFLAVRSRPNTVAAVAYDLKVFFTVGYRIAQAAKYPEWKPGTEFRAKREAMLKK